MKSPAATLTANGDRPLAAVMRRPHSSRKIGGWLRPWLIGVFITIAGCASSGGPLAQDASIPNGIHEQWGCGFQGLRPDRVSWQQHRTFTEPPSSPSIDMASRSKGADSDGKFEAAERRTFQLHRGRSPTSTLRSGDLTTLIGLRCLCCDLSGLVDGSGSLRPFCSTHPTRRRWKLSHKYGSHGKHR